MEKKHKPLQKHVACVLLLADACTMAQRQIDVQCFHAGIR